MSVRYPVPPASLDLLACSSVKLTRTELSHSALAALRSSVTARWLHCSAVTPQRRVGRHNCSAVAAQRQSQRPGTHWQRSSCSSTVTRLRCSDAMATHWQHCTVAPQQRSGHHFSAVATSVLLLGGTTAAQRPRTGCTVQLTVTSFALQRSCGAVAPQQRGLSQAAATASTWSSALEIGHWLTVSLTTPAQSVGAGTLAPPSLWTRRRWCAGRLLRWAGRRALPVLGTASPRSWVTVAGVCDTHCSGGDWQVSSLLVRSWVHCLRVLTPRSGSGSFRGGRRDAAGRGGLAGACEAQCGSLRARTERIVLRRDTARSHAGRLPCRHHPGHGLPSDNGAGCLRQSSLAV